MKPVIYRIDFPNGDFYVGATINFQRRRKHHLQALRSDKRSTSSRLTAALRQHGIACIYEVATGFDKTSVHELEAQYIQLEKPTLNANLTPAPLPPKTNGPSTATRVCTKYKVQTATYYYRRTHGWTVYQALGLQPRPNNRRTKVKQREITAGGQTLTLKAWAKKAGVSPGVIHSRLSNGWTNEQAVGLEKTPYMEKVEANKKQRRPSREKQIFTIGDLTGTVAELSRASGIPGHVIYARKKLGWPTEDWLQPVGSGKLSKEERVAAIKAAIAPYMAN